MAAIEGHSVVPWNGTAQVFGGKNRRDEYTADLWEVTVGAQGAVWKRVVASGEAPSPRAYHGATLWRNRYLMVVGGVGVDVDISLVHVLDLEEKVWRTREAGGDVPIPRCHHTLNATHHEDQLLLYGGYPVGESERLFSSGHVQPEHRPFFEVYSLDLTGADLAWRRVRCVEEFPPTLWGHTASLYFNNLIVFGGVDVVDNKESSLACVWHVDKQQWRWVEFNVAPQARALHSAVMYKGCVLTFGGFGLTNTCKFNDTWSFSLETGQWVELAAGGEIPCPRSGHAAYMIDDQLIVLGGVDAEHKRLNDVHVLNLQTASWRRLPVQVQGMEMHQVSSPAPPAYPDKMQGIEKAQMLLNRAAAQGAEYEGLHRKHFSTTTRPDEAAVSPPRTHPLPMREPPSQLHSAPPPSHPKFLPPQPVYDKSLENIVPFSDPTQIADNRHTSPRRGLEGVPPPPPPPQQGGFGRGPEVSFTQSVQTEVDGGGGGGVVALPPTNADPGLEREAADLIQSQRQEIEMLRAMLEDKKSPDSGALGPHTAPGEYLPHQLPGPPAPRISLTKETLVDMMPNLLGTSIIDTPSLSLPRTGKEGLMSRDAIQGLIDRRLNGHNVPILNSASPLLNPSLLPTSPANVSRYTVQRRDTGPSPSLPVQRQPVEAKTTSPERNRDSPVDLLAHDPFRMFHGNAPHAQPTDGSLPNYHPTMYTPPASYADLLKKSQYQPQPSSLPPTNHALPVAPSDPQHPTGSPPRPHKSPSLAKILKGGSMLSITHVQDPAERLPYHPRPVAP